MSRGAQKHELAGQRGCVVVPRRTMIGDHNSAVCYTARVSRTGTEYAELIANSCNEPMRSTD